MFRAFYNGPAPHKCDYSLDPAVDCYPATPPVRAVALYPNVDNQYVYGVDQPRRSARCSCCAASCRRHRGRSTATCSWAAGQLRYWSICQNEGLLTTAVEDCLYDEQIPTDSHGNYTIVTSLPGDRPAQRQHTAAASPSCRGRHNGDGAGPPQRRPPARAQHAPRAPTSTTPPRTPAPPATKPPCSGPTCQGRVHEHQAVRTARLPLRGRGPASLSRRGRRVSRRVGSRRVARSCRTRAPRAAAR